MSKIFTMLINTASNYNQSNDIANNQLNDRNTVQSPTTQTKNSQLAKDDKASSSEDITLSSRSQKLEAITGEFFSGRDLTQLDISKLAQRLNEYGLITQEQYGKLSNNLKSNNNANEPSQKLSAFLQNFSKSDNAKDLDENLTDSISNAEYILKNVNRAKEDKNFSLILDQTISEFDKFVASSEFKQLTPVDQQSFKTVSGALAIVDQITPKNLNNKQLNSYLAIAKM
ncbi:hypothetical protein [Pseudoalteromonas sp. NBT06-2]|uniref:hypothetical protein n=1 Tax=Pseudoalteromonas sp. NBT06-2 TaxID=2025950 RepID=UPI000BA5EE0C|nr:hypothetical protein [Pseudoalteromonas sp. NBT06-2]